MSKWYTFLNTVFTNCLCIYIFNLNICTHILGNYNARHDWVVLFPLHLNTVKLLINESFLNDPVI